MDGAEGRRRSRRGEAMDGEGQALLLRKEIIERAN